MGAIAFEIAQVVHQVHRRRAEAEGEERDQRRSQRRQVVVAMRGKKRQEDEQVLGPLLQPHRLEPEAQVTDTDRELALDVDGGARGPAQAFARVHDDAAACRAPHVQVVARIADVVEALDTVARLQRFRLAPGRDVGDAIARDHLVDAAEPRRHALHVLVVGRRAEDDLAAGLSLASHPGQELVVDRDAVEIEIDAFGDAPLHARLALPQPEGQLEDAPGLARDEPQRRLVQEIAADERSVQVHDERDRACVDAGHKVIASCRCIDGIARSASTPPTRRLSEIERSSG